VITPLGDKVLIRPEANPTQTDSGLHLVEHYKPENMGTVERLPERLGSTCVECGHLMFRQPDVKVGDTVIFGWDAGQEVFINEDRFLLIREADITAVLESV
jgi:co-chaperonin GroES (HSP10)